MDIRGVPVGFASLARGLPSLKQQFPRLFVCESADDLYERNNIKLLERTEQETRLWNGYLLRGRLAGMAMRRGPGLRNDFARRWLAGFVDAVAAGDERDSVVARHAHEVSTNVRASVPADADLHADGL